MNSILKITTLTHFALALLAPALLTATSALAQPFTIVEAGEYDIDSRTISSPGVLSEYFAMNLQGSGDALVRVRIGNQSSTRSLSNLADPRITSFLFSYDLAKEADISFRRGVVGTIFIEIVDESGNVNSSTSIVVNKNYGEKGCKRNKSKKLKTCRRVNLNTATSSQRSKLAKAFAKSLRRPIVLEP